jgi:hypothetical protein
MEKRFQGLELKHIPRGENVEADKIAKRASHRLAQPAGIFESISSSRLLLHHRPAQTFR